MGKLSVEQLLEQLVTLSELGTAYFGNSEPEEVDINKYDKRELDIDTAKKLLNDYGLRSIWLSEWYGISRQRVYQKLGKRVNHGRWCGKELVDYSGALKAPDRCFGNHLSGQRKSSFRK